MMIQVIILFHLLYHLPQLAQFEYGLLCGRSALLKHLQILARSRGGCDKIPYSIVSVQLYITNLGEQQGESTGYLQHKS